jgi:hypothetical protein
MEEIRDDPEFAHKRLARTLVEAHRELERFTTLKRLRIQIQRSVQRAFVRRGYNAESLFFWKKPGARVKAWRARHGLHSGE